MIQIIFFSKILRVIKEADVLKENEDFIYFEINDFKKKLKENFEPNIKILRFLRELNFIITEKNRLSKTINVNGKTQRVVAFKKQVYYSLEKIESEIKD